MVGAEARSRTLPPWPSATWADQRPLRSAAMDRLHGSGSATGSVTVTAETQVHTKVIAAEFAIS
jgi:hypothetical protein